MSFKFLCRILIKIKFKSKFWPDFERGNIWKEQELEMEVKLSIKIHRWIFLININNKNKYPVAKRKKKKYVKKSSSQIRQKVNRIKPCVLFPVYRTWNPLKTIWRELRKSIWDKRKASFFVHGSFRKLLRVNRNSWKVWRFYDRIVRIRTIRLI